MLTIFSLLMILLYAHIGGAVITGLIAAYSLVVIRNKKKESYGFNALLLALVASLEMISGALLSVFSKNAHLSSTCERLGLYLAIVVFVEVLLVKRMNTDTAKAFKEYIASPLIVSVTASAGIIATALAR